MRRSTSWRELRIAIDTGGTFTDCVWIERGQLRTLKVFSTPDDPARAILTALTEIGVDRDLALLHGTTVGTNALLERKGARVALITTEGFEDAIEIGRQNRLRLYDLLFEKPKPLVPVELRFGIEERTAADGSVLKSPDPQQIHVLLETLKVAEPQALAISLLFSFANPENEKKVVDALQGLGIPLSISHKLLPEFREYERTSTVVINAYLQPLLGRYLWNLSEKASSWLKEKGTENPRSRFFVMQSNGGIAALETSAEEPVRTVLSGPAGGVVGAVAMARLSGFDRIISFDMGGTSTDVALIDKQSTISSQSEIAGLPVSVPMLDIHTVGAGGGSLARFDAGGALRVGPESAGADPGPICYGRGIQPTVTDANLLLGRLPADRFLGGEFQLDLERTRALVSEWLKKRGSSLRLEQFAAGVIRVVNANMEKAIRVVSIERGHDPREFSLVAFGGAGAMHACEIAASLRIPRVIVPALPGALSALGILSSDVVKDFSRTVLWRVQQTIPEGQAQREFTILERRAKDSFSNEGWDGRIRLQRSADLRYRGQGYEINVPFTKTVLNAFHAEHQRRNGYSHPDREVEVVTLRVRARMTWNHSAPAFQNARTSKPEKQIRVPVEFGGAIRKTAIASRVNFTALKRYSGPAIVTEYSATTVVPPGMSFRLDRVGNIVIDCGRHRSDKK